LFKLALTSTTSRHSSPADTGSAAAAVTEIVSTCNSLLDAGGHHYYGRNMTNGPAIVMPGMPDNLSLWPRAGASAAIFRRDAVLLVKRGSGPWRGLWSLPGGHIEPGEWARAAAAREIREETGLSVEIIGIADVHDVIIRNARGALSAHYVLAVYYGRSLSGDPVAASDCQEARFVPLSELEDYALTEGAGRIVDLAAELLGGSIGRCAELARVDG
jgi:8-oxo-dGTP diphosphatase